jgi:hypothetical protein
MRQIGGNWAANERQLCSKIAVKTLQLSGKVAAIKQQSRGNQAVNTR